ncbi:MAG TPA: nucleotidyltransferase domain-containing protein [Bacteroidetes bacterium]|nr:nucleotidyltransferase domain-containing protein [Bacteroidota bacterium]
MKLHPEIEQHMEPLINLCKHFRVEKLFLFGSALTDRFDPKKSDLDFIVELEKMPPIEKGELLMKLWNELEGLFGKKVDLLTDQPIKNPYLRKNVEATKKLIYDRQSEKIPV